jgi:hypothetical protein
VSETVVAEGGKLLPIDSLEQTFAYTGSDLTSISVTYAGFTYVQTFTYDAGNLTNVSQWVQQP